LGQKIWLIVFIRHKYTFECRITW